MNNPRFKKLLNKLTRELTNTYLAKKGFFPPEQVGAETDGSLEFEADEASYMQPNFSAQIYRELSDRQLAGELSNGEIVEEQRSPEAGRQGERVAFEKMAAKIKRGPEVTRQAVRYALNEIQNSWYDWSDWEAFWEYEAPKELLIENKYWKFDPNIFDVEQAGRVEIQEVVAAGVKDVSKLDPRNEREWKGLHYRIEFTIPLKVIPSAAIGNAARFIEKKEVQTLLFQGTHVYDFDGGNGHYQEFFKALDLKLPGDEDDFDF